MTTDPITHGLIGIAIATVSGHPIAANDPVFLGTFFGAMLPDLDIVTYYKGRINYLLKHRGVSHSVPALLGMAFLLSTFLYALFPAFSWTTILLGTLMGTLSHGLADLLNSYGAQLFWPFIRKKITLDMVMVTDPLVFSLLLFACLGSLYAPEWGVILTWSALGLSFLYFVIREHGRRRKKALLFQQFPDSQGSAVKILPAMYKPFNWAFLIFHEQYVRFGVFQKGRAKILGNLPTWDKDDPLIANAMEGELADLFTRLTPYYHICLNENEAEPRIEFMDLRYWNRKDFLYTGEVKLSPDGQIEQETFYHVVHRNSRAILLES